MVWSADLAGTFCSRCRCAERPLAGPQLNSGFRPTTVFMAAPARIGHLGNGHSYTSAKSSICSVAGDAAEPDLITVYAAANAARASSTHPVAFVSSKSRRARSISERFSSVLSPRRKRP